MNYFYNSLNLLSIETWLVVCRSKVFNFCHENCSGRLQFYQQKKNCKRNKIFNFSRKKYILSIDGLDIEMTNHIKFIVFLNLLLFGCASFKKNYFLLCNSSHIYIL